MSLISVDRAAQELKKHIEATNGSPANGYASPQKKPSSKLPSGDRIRWKKGDLIGAGSYGKVYIGLNENSGVLMAVKEVEVCDAKEAKSLQQEIDLMRSLSHDNIVAYLGSEVDAEEHILYIFTEWVPGGSISNILQKFGRLTENVVRNYTRQVLTGLDYLHSKGVIHRDIKGANILVDDRATIKLADFGASKRLFLPSANRKGRQPDLSLGNKGTKSLRGTPYFMAPEVVKQSGHGRKADIWSVGCTVLQMITGKPPWKAMQFPSVSALLYHICNTNKPPEMPDAISNELRSFLMICFQREPAERPTAKRMLQHPFVAFDGRKCSVQMLTPFPKLNLYVTLETAADRHKRPQLQQGIGSSPSQLKRDTTVPISNYHGPHSPETEISNTFPSKEDSISLEDVDGSQARSNQAVDPDTHTRSTNADFSFSAQSPSGKVTLAQEKDLTSTGNVLAQEVTHYLRSRARAERQKYDSLQPIDHLDRTTSVANAFATPSTLSRTLTPRDANGNTWTLRENTGKEPY